MRTLSREGTLTRAHPVTVRVTLSGLSGPYLPAVGWPVRLTPGTQRSGAQQSGAQRCCRVWFSDRSGVLLTDAASISGFSYEMTGALAGREEGLPRARPTPAARHSGAVALPAGLPPQVLALARRITGTETTPYGKLLALERYLRALPYNLDAPPGHSYGALATMLTGTQPHHDEGHAEQRAAAFAVLARAQGFPARVAVGYLLRGGSNGSYTVTTRDAHAWAEVSFDGYGWVPFEPTDTAKLPAHPQRQPDPPAAVPGPAVAPGPGPGPAFGGPGQGRSEASGSAPPVAEPAPRPEGRSGNGRVGVPTRRWLAVGLAGVGLAGAALAGVVVGVAVLVVAGKARLRRRRRHAPGQAACVAGAWQEASDRLVEYGLTLSPALTAAEVAERASAVLGPVTGAVTQLAPVATDAVFAPVEPDERTAAAAWALEARLRRDLRAARGPAVALRARLDPRPLLAALRSARHARQSGKQRSGKQLSRGG